MPIRQLPPELAAQIAAGEVVERPASVVKELLENSLDAGASRIAIEIRGGGIELVRVADDGSGIPPDEVALAFQRHATSKLDSPELLDAIPTLGFRGEALPSIAAVSRVSLTTRPHQSGSGLNSGPYIGIRAECSWGNPVSQTPQGCPPGTTIEVRDLFGNLPARRRFLKSPNAESGRVHDLVACYSLAYPDVSFQLKVGDRIAVSTPGALHGKSGPLNAALAVYGAESAAQLLEIGEEDPESGYLVEGFVGNPGLHRANRTYMTFFVNRRWIQSRMLSFALEEAYHGLLPEKRYPLAALNLVLPYDDVDVNSHPTKREVRFRQDGKVYSALQRAVRSALVSHSPVRGMHVLSGGRGQAPKAGAAPQDIPGQDGVKGTAGFFRSPFEMRPNPAGGQTGRHDGEASHYTETRGLLYGGGPPGAALTPQQTLPALRVVGQVRLTYIVAESPDGMYLVDQHAAHERVLFDRIVRQAASRQPQSQPLLAPVTAELTSGQAATLDAHRDFLRDYGFEVEEFGQDTWGRSYLVRAVPAVLTTQDPAKSLVDVLDMVAFEGLLKERDDILAASVACHSAIRAGQSMTEPEMRALLEQLEVTDNPHTCPHGRPTLIHFSSYHMEREFGRR